MPSSTATAATLTTDEVQSILVEPLGLASVFLAAGPRIFDTPGRTVRVPTLVSMVAPSWVGENTLIPEVDPTFGEVVLLPDTMQSLKSLTRFSSELARQSVISLDAALRDRMVQDVAGTLDAQLIGVGGNGTTTPQGLLGYAGTQSIAVTGAITVDVLHDAQGRALAAGVNLASTRWVMRPETFTALRKIKDTSGRYLIEPDVTAANGFSLLGHPVSVSKALPIVGTAPGTTSLVLADFSKIAVARDLAPTVKVLDQTFGNYDQLALRVVARYDAKPLNPEAIVKVTGFSAA